MSIAVSVVVRPSRLLLWMVGAMCALTFCIGGMMAAGFEGDLSAPMRFVIAVSSFFLAFFGFYHTVRNRKVQHIDISGDGQLRLRKPLADAGTCQERKWPHVDESAMVVRLLEDSTLWPHLLLLRLQAEDGHITVIPVLPDCVSRDDFRALSVACRWVAAHGNLQDEKNL